jgi:hypothetical protein
MIECIALGIHMLTVAVNVDNRVPSVGRPFRD